MCTYSYTRLRVRVLVRVRVRWYVRNAMCVRIGLRVGDRMYFVHGWIDEYMDVRLTYASIK